MKFKRMILFIFLLLILISCKEKMTSEPDLYTYQVPEQLDDGWSVSSLQEEDMDTGIIEQVTSKIMSKQFRGIHSLLIVKNGVLVHEAYFEDYQRSSLHTVYSITKSISSALIGIAIDQNMIHSIEDPVLSFFPQYSIPDSNKQKIALRHILTLTSGFNWDEKSYPYSDPRNTETQMVATSDWMKFVLERPLQSDPGTEWVYNTGSVHLLSGIIKRVSGMYADTFAEQTLFQPLGIIRYEWNKDPQGYPCTGATLQGLRLKSRDTAKFGYIFLNKGRWQEQQVVPEKWVEESTRQHLDIDDDSGFGYLWRTGSFTVNGRTIPHFFAAGYGGQTIHIVPELDLMIVVTCWNNAHDADIFLPMLLIYSAIL
jgi:CubicO group peptidase (beta-lactamase class C family)